MAWKIVNNGKLVICRVFTLANITRTGLLQQGYCDNHRLNLTKPVEFTKVDKPVLVSPKCAGHKNNNRLPQNLTAATAICLLAPVIQHNLKIGHCCSSCYLYFTDIK